MARQVGTINKKLIKLLGLNVAEGTPIYFGDSNLQHMQSSHPADFAKYGSHLQSILNAPDYVATNPKDGSIEFVKEFKVDNEYVKVAVRVSAAGKFFARSLYILNNNRVNNFINKGTLIKY